jgi:hypothetical protein
MRKISAMQRLDETTVRLGGNGDNWHMSWADDDRQYTALCDGRGWPNMPGYPDRFYNARVFAIRGDMPQPSFEYLRGYPLLPSPSRPESNIYYGFGIISLDGHIYHFLSTPNHAFREPEPRFVGAKLIYSPDNGETWKNQDGSAVRWEGWDERNRDNMAFFFEPGDAFSLLTVLQMGKNYQANRDGYVYVYAPDGNLEGGMNRLVMFRVPRGLILQREAYEYFVSRNDDGGARWSKDMEERGAVHSFPEGWVNTQVHPYAWHPSVIYNPPLGCYMMANWGMGCAPDGMWFGKPSYLGFWTAPEPWGPWSQVHEETAWTPLGDRKARCYQPQISPKWLAQDGRSFWLVWTDFQVIDGERPYYAFNAQKVLVHC